MIVKLNIKHDHSPCIGDEFIGVRGDHKTDILSVSFQDCGFDFSRAKIHFDKPNGERVCTDYIEIGENQTFDYEIPYSILEVAGNILVGVTAETADGKIFESKGKKYLIYDNVEGLKPIEDKITELELENADLKDRVEQAESAETILCDLVEGNTLDLVLPPNITKIRGYAFYNNSGITSVEIPDSVESIGTEAFRYTRSLERVVVGEGVTSISSNCFRSAGSADKGLTIIFKGKGITEILRETFADSNLENIMLPDSITTIAAYAFMNATKLKTIELPDSVIVTKDSSTNNMAVNMLSAFSGCTSLESAILGRGVKRLNKLFGSCTSLKYVICRGELSYVDDYTFSGCTALEYVDFTACTSVPTLKHRDAFKNVPSTCEIRVPSSLYDAWIVGSNWSNFASQIVAVEV